MDRFREVVIISIGRAVFFAGFAITMVMFGFAFDYALAVRSGAILTLGLAAILLWFSQTVNTGRLEDCEAWVLLREEDRPSNEAARQMLGDVLRETYLFFAVRAFTIAVALLAAFILLKLGGVTGGIGQ